MALSITNWAPAPSESWDRAWASCAYSTYFHSREWAEIWREYTSGKSEAAARLVTFSDGRTAVLPMSCEHRSRGLPRRYMSSPAGTFGGWISEDELGDVHRAELARYLAREVRDLVWRVNPYDEVDYLGIVERLRTDETQALELAVGFEAVLKGWTKGHRSAANKARREGVKVSLAHTSDDWRVFQAIYADSVRRWGDRASSVYTPHLFDVLRRRQGPALRLWLAHRDGTAIAGAICLYSPNHVAYWLGGATESQLSHRPVHLLLQEAIADACAEGRRWFDFNPSGGHQGVDAFKKGFGTVRLASPVIVTTSLRSRVVQKGRSLLARARVRTGEGR